MPSCKDEYKWCKDEFENGKKPAYIDDAGGEHCIFHAPKGRKGVFLEEFNDRVFKRINNAINAELLKKSQQAEAVKQRALKHGTICILHGTVFEGDISFSHYDESNPLPEISFWRAKFNGEANFFLAAFNGVADFSFAEFNGGTNFACTKFSGKTYFSGAEFRFSKDKIADFAGAEFGEETIFYSAKFWIEANFSNATFGGEADFSFTKFKEKANFDGAKFNEGAHFYNEIDKKGKTFFKGATFRDFYAKEKIRFERINLKEVSFLGSDLRNVDFINCKWQEQKGRDILYDEVLLLGGTGKGIWQKAKRWLLSFKQRDTGEIKKVEILYRRLKQKYTDEHDWPEVSNWHYGEKEMIRKQDMWIQIFLFKNIFTHEYLPKVLKKFVYDLYWLSSGYGERPVRAGIILGGLIFGISFFMYLSGLEPSSNAPAWVKDLKEYHKPFANVLNTLQYVTFLKEPILKPASLIGEYLTLFSRILIPIQTALFVLAIRNRFRR